MKKRLSDAQIAAQIMAKIAAMRDAVVNTRTNSPTAQMGDLAGIAANWTPGKSYALGELFTYNGTLGYARQAVTAQAHQPPFSVGMEAVYGVRPAADPDGVYPYVYNMRAEPGMRVRENGVIYVCIAAAPVDPLLYPPSQAPALFTKEEDTAINDD